MTCYNCGYEVSVVSKDDIGWLCEWCSDNGLRSPVIKRLKERLEECETNSNKISMKDDWVEYVYQMRLIPELKKLMEEKK